MAIVEDLTAVANASPEKMGGGEALSILQSARTQEKGVVPATVSAVFTAVIASACCWLPLLLIAFGVSAAGVGSFFEKYRAYFLTATFGLLGVAWYFSYRSATRRALARLRSRPGSLPAAMVSCCSTEAKTINCHSSQSSKAGTDPVRQRFAVRRFNRPVLWSATVLIVLAAVFPHWSGLIFGAGNNPSSEATITDAEETIVLQLSGMTCEGCVATVQQALNKVPGVSRVTVNHARSEAAVVTQKCCPVSYDSLIRAVRDAGFNAQVSG
jgi:copper chaperone CopZ